MQHRKGFAVGHAVPKRHAEQAAKRQPPVCIANEPRIVRPLGKRVLDLIRQFVGRLLLDAKPARDRLRRQAPA
ncbi:hypothetical protein D3C83_201410 [compost metagenome]